MTDKLTGDGVVITAGENELSRGRKPSLLNSLGKLSVRCYVERKLHTSVECDASCRIFS